MNSLEFFDALQKSKFGQEYLKLVESCKDRGIKKESGYEIHHIYPRCFGGTSEKSNLVKFTVFEHLLGHYYLVKALDHPKLLYSFSFIVGPQFRKLSEQDQISLQKLEGWAQLRTSAIHRHLTEEHKQNIGKANKGRKLSDEVRKMRSQIAKRPRPSRRGVPMSEETKQKILLARKGFKHSEESKQKMRLAKLGKPSPLRGKTYSEEARKNVSKAHVGNKRISKENVRSWCKESELLAKLEEGWKLGW